MSLAHSPKIITDGLVFAYDMANTKKSWKGAPTTNMISTPLNLDDVPYYAQSGWSCTRTNSYKTTMDSDGFGVKFNVTTSGGASYTSLQFYKGNYTLTAGVSYIHSMYVYTNVSFSIQIGVIQNGGSYTAYIPLQTYTLNVGWNRIVSSGSYGSTVSDARTQISFGSAPVGTELVFYKPQLEQSSFVTPFVNGTRGTTDVIKDLSKSNNTITANSLTYNSDGSFEFTSTGSNITIPTINFVSEQTIEMVFKWNNTSTRCNMYDQAYGGQGTITNETTRTLNYYCGSNGGNAETYVSFNSVSVLNTGQIYHAVVTRSISGINWYINGNLSASYTNSILSSIAYSTNTIRVGQGYAGNFSGNIYSTKLYDRALTEAEVKQNFNAIRGRYGL